MCLCRECIELYCVHSHDFPIILLFIAIHLILYIDVLFMLRNGILLLYAYPFLFFFSFDNIGLCCFHVDFDIILWDQRNDEISRVDKGNSVWGKEMNWISLLTRFNREVLKEKILYSSILVRVTYICTHIPLGYRKHHNGISECGQCVFYAPLL